LIHDFCVIGGGIVGLATAMKILEMRPGASLLLIEKEDRVGFHQTGHNSGVIHAGIYYEPGSLKAKLCRAGLDATKAFCDEHGIRYDTTGKLIVATNEIEQKRIDALFERATANGLTLERIDARELNRLEPAITGVGALLSPETAIVDYRQVAARMADIIREKGADIEMGAAVDRIRETETGVEVGAGDRQWTARKLVVCGGAQADRLARMAGIETDFRIVPFRGEYYQLPASKNDIIKHLIYPAPDPSLPFLGIHLTRMIDGSVTVGPNAVIGFAREGYPKFSFRFADAIDFATFPGFWKLVFKNRGSAMHELRNSAWKQGYLQECRKYCPSLELSDLLPYRAGIRAQAVDKSGKAMHDFHFIDTDHMLHVGNAPSPAATSAIPIGAMIAERLLGRNH
jgi:L-2-hydroxyglutarate oxidase